MEWPTGVLGSGASQGNAQSYQRGFLVGLVARSGNPNKVFPASNLAYIYHQQLDYESLGDRGGARVDSCSMLDFRLIFAYHVRP